MPSAVVVAAIVIVVVVVVIVNAVAVVIVVFVIVVVADGGVFLSVSIVGFWPKSNRTFLKVGGFKATWPASGSAVARLGSMARVQASGEEVLSSVPANLESLHSVRFEFFLRKLQKLMFCFVNILKCPEINFVP